MRETWESREILTSRCNTREICIDTLWLQRSCLAGSFHCWCHVHIGGNIQLGVGHQLHLSFSHHWFHVWCFCHHWSWTGEPSLFFLPFLLYISHPLHIFINILQTWLIVSFYMETGHPLYVIVCTSLCLRKCCFLVSSSLCRWKATHTLIVVWISIVGKLTPWWCHLRHLPWIWFICSVSSWFFMLSSEAQL